MQDRQQTSKRPRAPEPSPNPRNLGGGEASRERGLAAKAEPTAERERLLCRGEYATKLWNLLREPEPFLSHLNGRELEIHLKRAVFGQVVTAEQQRLHAKTLRAIEDIGNNFDPLRYYSTVMGSWKPVRFGELTVNDVALLYRPRISLTPLTVEIGCSGADWARIHPDKNKITKASIIRGGALPPELSSRLVFYLNEESAGSAEQRLAWRFHERAHALGYRYSGRLETYIPSDFRLDLARTLPRFDRDVVERGLERSIETFSAGAWGEVAAHYLSGGRLTNVMNYLDEVSPASYLRELYEYLWLVDLPPSQRQAIYQSAAHSFRAAKRAAHEYHYLADCLFHPRDGGVRHPSAEGLLLCTSPEGRASLAPIVGLDLQSVRGRMQAEMAVRLESLDARGATLGESDVDEQVNFAWALVVGERLFGDGKVSLEGLAARAEEAEELLSGSPDALPSRLTRTIFRIGAGVSKRGAQTGNAELEASGNTLREAARIHHSEHYPSFFAAPPVRKQAYDLVEMGTLDAISALVELLPARNARYWDKHIFPDRVIQILVEHRSWGLMCDVLERSGTFRAALGALWGCTDLPVSSASESDLQRFRKLVDELPKRFPSFSPMQGAVHKTSLQIRLWWKQSTRFWARLNGIPVP